VDGIVDDLLDEGRDDGSEDASLLRGERRGGATRLDEEAFPVLRADVLPPVGGLSAIAELRGELAVAREDGNDVELRVCVLVERDRAIELQGDDGAGVPHEIGERT
jgi:hypothetical protein